MHQGESVDRVRVVIYDLTGSHLVWTGWTLIQGNIYEWDECISPMNTSARFSETFSVELVPLSSPLSDNCCTRILAGHNEGASLINRNVGLDVVERWTAGDDTPVSYTHLTLPTKRIV